MDLFKQLDIDCCDQIHHGCSYFRRRKQQRSKLKNDDNYGNIYNNIPSKMVSSKQAHCQRQHADHLVSAYSHRDYPIPLIDNKFISLKTYTHFILNHSTIQMTLILILTLFIQTTSSQVNNFAISPNLHNRNSGQCKYMQTNSIALRMNRFLLSLTNIDNFQNYFYRYYITIMRLKIAISAIKTYRGRDIKRLPFRHRR